MKAINFIKNVIKKSKNIFKKVSMSSNGSFSPVAAQKQKAKSLDKIDGD